MKKSEAASRILRGKKLSADLGQCAEAFAPANIALCKYWGKRDQTLNLPVTSSLSVSLGQKGTLTKLTVTANPVDTVMLNHQPVDPSSDFLRRISTFLDDLLSADRCHFHVDTHSGIPVAAGLASSASGFAALTMALERLYEWQLSATELSILARLGSGSACRSLWQGFVEWQAGSRADGMDSFAVPLAASWPALCIGLSIVSGEGKHISSREAMQRTVETSPFYAAWPLKVAKDLQLVKTALETQDFSLLGRTAESNALAMHATMMSAWPPVVYAQPETIETIKKVWHLRDEGLPVYFTEDAGPNIKLLFLKKNSPIILKYFPGAEIVCPAV